MSCVEFETLINDWLDARAPLEALPAALRAAADGELQDSPGRDVPDGDAGALPIPALPVVPRPWRGPLDCRDCWSPLFGYQRLPTGVTFRPLPTPGWCESPPAVGCPAGIRSGAAGAVTHSSSEAPLKRGLGRAWKVAERVARREMRRAGRSFAAVVDPQQVDREWRATGAGIFGWKGIGWFRRQPGVDRPACWGFGKELEFGLGRSAGRRLVDGRSFNAVRRVELAGRGYGGARERSGGDRSRQAFSAPLPGEIRPMNQLVREMARHYQALTTDASSSMAELALLLPPFSGDLHGERSADRSLPELPAIDGSADPQASRPSDPALDRPDLPGQDASPATETLADSAGAGGQAQLFRCTCSHWPRPRREPRLVVCFFRPRTANQKKAGIEQAAEAEHARPHGSHPSFRIPAAETVECLGCDLPALAPVVAGRRRPGLPMVTAPKVRQTKLERKGDRRIGSRRRRPGGAWRDRRDTRRFRPSETAVRGQRFPDRKWLRGARRVVWLSARRPRVHLKSTISGSTCSGGRCC